MFWPPSLNAGKGRGWHPIILIACECLAHSSWRDMMLFVWYDLINSYQYEHVRVGEDEGGGRRMRRLPGWHHSTHRR